MSGKTILILGAGVGGLVAAHRLRERLGREHRVVVVDKNAQHVFAPSLLWLMVGWRRAPQISRDLRRLARRGIEFVQAEVQAIDPAMRKATTSAGEFAADYLVVALGAELDPEATPGLAESSHWYFDLPGAERLREALANFDGGRVVLAIAGLPYKCPGAPWEGALLLDYYFRQRGVRDRVEMSAYTPEPLPMPVAGPVVGKALKEMVEARGIAFSPQARLTSVDAGRRELAFEDGRKVEYDLLVTIPPHRCPAAVKNAGLAGETGWASVNARTMATAFDRVYALGDVTMIKLANGKPLPKAGVFAHGQAESVARTIVADIARSGKPVEFNGEGYCIVETGYGQAALGAGNFYTEPDPVVALEPPSRFSHLSKVALEKYWLWRWFGGQLPGLQSLADRLVFGPALPPE
jgi:sulfide:quinone oxidoreductase